MHTWLVGDENQVLQNSTFSPNLSPAVYFLVSREKNLLYVIRLTQKVMKTTLEGVRHLVIEDHFAADFSVQSEFPTSVARRTLKQCKSLTGINCQLTVKRISCLKFSFLCKS